MCAKCGPGQVRSQSLDNWFLSRQKLSFTPLHPGNPVPVRFSDVLEVNFIFKCRLGRPPDQWDSESCSVAVDSNEQPSQQQS